jgi:hypothetical protein
MKGAFKEKIKSLKEWSTENPIFIMFSKRNLPAKKKIQSLAFPLQADLSL